jgi:hypothetical protein
LLAFGPLHDKACKACVSVGLDVDLGDALRLSPDR